VVALAEQEQGAIGYSPLPSGEGLGVRVRCWRGLPGETRTLSLGPSPGGRGMQGGVAVQIEVARQRFIAEVLQRFVIMLRLARGFGLAVDVAVDAAALLRDLGEVAHPVAGNQPRRTRFLQGRVDLRIEIAANGLAQS